MSEHDEQVVTPAGEVCTIKDCCIMICDTVVMPNPGRGAYTDRAVIDRAFNAVCGGIEKGYGQDRAQQVADVLFALPITYNARLSRAIGRAKFVNEKGIPRPTIIELTGSIDIPADYMHGLLVHEGCHVAHCVLAGGAFAYEEAHGSRWKELMRGAGEKGEARCSDPRLVNVEHAKAVADRSRMRRGGPAVAMSPDDVTVGDTVSFSVKGERVLARVVEKVKLGVVVQSVESKHVKWRVGYGLLTKEQP